MTMRPNSKNKMVFRSMWGWKGKSASQLQTAPAVSPLLPAKLIQIAQSNVETVLEMLNTSSEGLSELQSTLRLGKIGLNEIAHEKPRKWYVQLLKTFQNPLVILLMTLAVIALLTEDIKAAVISNLSLVTGNIFKKQVKIAEWILSSRNYRKSVTKTARR